MTSPDHGHGGRPIRACRTCGAQTSRTYCARCDPNRAGRQAAHDNRKAKYKGKPTN